jgi:hypothetical protein
VKVLVAIAWLGCGSHSAPTPDDAPRRVPPQQQIPARASVTVDDGRACAIEASGKVACWQDRVEEVAGVEDVIGIASGTGGTCAWTRHGTVACWHDGPAHAIAGLDDIVQISVGIDSACGLHATGRVSCWSDAQPPHEVPTIADAVELAGAYGVGAESLCVRSKSGAVACGNRVTPFQAIPPLAGATSLAGGGARFAALVPGRRFATWVGWTGSPMPVFVDGVDGERAIVGGHLNADAGVCVLGARPRCWAWAGEPSLRLSDAPALPPGVRDIAFDTDATCARIADRVECWGRLGRLGDGTTEYTPDFVPVAGLADVTQLEAAGRTMCALHGKRVACWGERLSSDDVDTRGAIEPAPVELPGVADANEIAMEAAAIGDGSTVAVAVCARREHGATCWTSSHGSVVAADAPELAAATHLYSGSAICGASPSGAVRCVHFGHDRGAIGGFGEQDYERYVYSGRPNGVRDELARRLARALPAKVAAGFHDRTSSDTSRLPLPAHPDFVQMRAFDWRDDERARGVACGRRRDGTAACWGERDYLGAGQRSARAEPAPIGPTR